MLTLIGSRRLIIVVFTIVSSVAARSPGVVVIVAWKIEGEWKLIFVIFDYFHKLQVSIMRFFLFPRIISFH